MVETVIKTSGLSKTMGHPARNQTQTCCVSHGRAMVSALVFIKFPGL